jgi:hypothetical protein
VEELPPIRAELLTPAVPTRRLAYTPLSRCAVLHLLLAVPTLALLWSLSYPGFDFWIGVPSILLLLAAAFGWVVAVVVTLVRRRRARACDAPLPSRRWMAAAPLGLVAVLVVVATHLPLRVRFEMGRSAFDRVAERLAHPDAGPPTSDEDDWKTLDRHGRVGSYDITQTERVRSALILYEANGDFLVDDAGFAYLPDGPDPDLSTGWFESPTFVHLSGDWYAFTASW